MNRYFWFAIAGILVLVMGNSCRQIDLEPRALTPEEQYWQESLKKWYPAWQPPYLSPLRNPGRNNSGDPPDLEKVLASPADMEADPASEPVQSR